MDSDSYTLAVSQIEAATNKADGMIGYFPRYQLYLAKGMADLAAVLFPEHARDLARMSGAICRKINEPKYFDCWKE